MWQPPLCLALRPPVLLLPVLLLPAHPLNQLQMQNLLLQMQNLLPKASPTLRASLVTAKQSPLWLRWSAPTLVWPVLKMPRRAVVHDLRLRQALSPSLSRTLRP
jgi:hypothetical protein